MERKVRSIVVSATQNYKPGLTALTNSFYEHHPQSDIKIYLLTPHADFFKDFSDRLNIVETEVIKNNNAWSTKIPRFKFASELPGTVMVVDADMFFCTNIEMLFRISEAGIIVAGSNGSNFRFHQGWRDKYKLDVPDLFQYKTMTSVPTVMSTHRHKRVWRDIYKHKMKDGEGADFDLVNVFIGIHGFIDDLFVIPSQQVTGVHHFMLKPCTRVIEKENKLMTMDGLEVLTVHGKWWQENWVNNLFVKMEGYLEKEQMGEKNMIGVQHSVNILKNAFEYYRNLK